MRICMIVPDQAVKGGIASVVNGYHGSVLEQKYEVDYVESYRDGTKLQKLFKALGGYVCFAKRLVRNRPDVVHIHSSFGPSFYRKMPFIYMSGWAGVPVVNHIHGAEFDSFYQNASVGKKKLVRRVYGKCSRLIVLSSEWKRMISHIVPADRIDVIENYCVIPKEPYDTGRRRNQILFLGELGERKGCFDIPAILERVRQAYPSTHLVMAGDGQMEQVKAAFQKRGLLPYVEFAGWVRGEEKRRLFEESAVFLFPTYHEGMPMVVLEAMSYGLGIVTTRVGGIPRLICHEKNGYLEEPGQIERMAQDTVRLLQDEMHCRSMGRQARELAGRQYSLEQHLHKLEQTYRKVFMK